MVECGTITVWVPAHIIAYSMDIVPTDCDEPCNATITVTWKNIGGRTQEITPAIIVGTVRTPALTPIILAKNQTATVIFNVTGLTEGNYLVCPDPS